MFVQVKKWTRRAQRQKSLESWGQHEKTINREDQVTPVLSPPKQLFNFPEAAKSLLPFFSCLKVNLQRQMSHASGVFVLHDATRHKMLKVLAKKRDFVVFIFTTLAV